MKKSEETDTFKQCPVSEIQPIIHGKWAMVVLAIISQGTIRFGELSRKLPMVTQANLTKELRMLEQYGFIHREVYREVPPKVEYSLTEIGEAFLPVMKALEKFAHYYHDTMQSKDTTQAP